MNEEASDQLRSYITCYLRFMAQTLQELGYGGQRLAKRELGWNRDGSTGIAVVNTRYSVVVRD